MIKVKKCNKQQNSFFYKILNDIDNIRNNKKIKMKFKELMAMKRHIGQQRRLERDMKHYKKIKKECHEKLRISLVKLFREFNIKNMLRKFIITMVRTRFGLGRFTTHSSKTGVKSTIMCGC